MRVKLKKSLLTLQKILTIMIKSGFLFTDNKFSNTQEFTFFNISYLFLGLKEFISNLEFIHNSKKGRVYLYIEHSYTRYLVKFLLKEFKFVSKFVRIIRFSRELYAKPKSSTTLLIIIGSQTKSFFFEAIRKKIRFIHVINNKKNLPITGIFHMYTNIPNMMKTIFIFTLINKVFSKKKVEEIKPIIEKEFLPTITTTTPASNNNNIDKPKFHFKKQSYFKVGFSSQDQKTQYHAFKRYFKRKNSKKKSDK